MWLGFLQILGLGKQSILFEDDLAIRVIRLLQQPIAGHPVVIASKKILRKKEDNSYRADISVVSENTGSEPSGIVTARVTLRNTGTASWPAFSDSGLGQVGIGVQLLASDGRILNRAFRRIPLSANVPPGGSQTVVATFLAPDEPGDYLLNFDLVAEGIKWFESPHSSAHIRALSVTNSKNS